MDLLDLLNYVSKSANLNVYLFLLVTHKTYSPCMNVASSNKVT